MIQCGNYSDLSKIDTHASYKKGKANSIHSTVRITGKKVELEAEKCFPEEVRAEQMMK